jgi:hypothetical protein
METPCLARPEPVKWTRSGVVRSGQEPAQFGGIGDRVDERLPWLHDQAGACAGGRVAGKGFPAQKVSWMSPFPVFREKGCPACHLFQPKGVHGGAQPGRGGGQGCPTFGLIGGGGVALATFWPKLGPASPTALVAENFTLFRRASAAESYPKAKTGPFPGRSSAQSSPRSACAVDRPVAQPRSVSFCASFRTLGGSSPRSSAA